LKDGTSWKSIPEAYMYLIYKENNKYFLYNKVYGDILKKKRYDFYFPNENKYVEVTSYLQTYEHWKRYYANILKKKDYVENFLKAKFEFIQFTPTKEQIEFVRQNSKKF
jgi:hypothetical protein